MVEVEVFCREDVKRMLFHCLIDLLIMRRLGKFGMRKGACSRQADDANITVGDMRLVGGIYHMKAM